MRHNDADKYNVDETMEYAKNLYPLILELYTNNYDNIYLNEAILSIEFVCIFEIDYEILENCINKVIDFSDDDVLKNILEQFIEMMQS